MKWLEPVLHLALQTVEEGLQLEQVQPGDGGQPALLQARRLETEYLYTLNQVFLDLLGLNEISLHSYLDANM